MRVMERAAVGGLELEYELRGSGDPVVLIHWGVSATWAEPLLDEPALADRFRLLTYHRAGFGGSSSIDGPVSMADHAEHCRLLMRQLGIERAHIVGHSSSVAVALQLALDAPDAVQTIVSMDAARPSPPTELQAAFRREFVEPAVERYRAGDKEGAVDTFFRGVFGPGYRDPLERGLPGAFEQAVSDADTFFMQELPALWERWSFTEDGCEAGHSARARRRRRAQRQHLSRATRPAALLASERGALRAPRRDAPTPSSERRRDGRGPRVVLRAAPARKICRTLQVILYVDISEIHDGALEELKQAITKLVDFVEANEPRLIAYNVYFSDDGTRMTVVNLHPDSASLEYHLEVAGPLFRPFVALVTLSSIHIYGEPSEKVLEQSHEKARLLGEASVVVEPLYAGFARVAQAAAQGTTPS